MGQTARQSDEHGDLQMSIETMKQALEVLENTSPLGFNMESDKKFYAVITSLRQAIAAEEKQEALQKLHDENERLGLYQGVYEQKPVAEVKRNSSGQIYIEWRDGEFAMANLVGEKFYISPPQRQWVWLTEEEREQHRNDWYSNIHDKEFEAIEDKLRRKNT